MAPQRLPPPIHKHERSEILAPGCGGSCNLRSDSGRKCPRTLRRSGRGQALSPARQGVSYPPRALAR